MRIMTTVMPEYPRQTSWAMVGIYHAEGGLSERSKRCKKVFEQVKAQVSGVVACNESVM